MPNSTSTAKRQKDFPLTKRGDGRFQKKHGGKTYYFRGTAQECLKEWNRIKEDVYAGHEPRDRATTLTIKELVNRFLTFKQDAVESGELSQRSWNDYEKVCREVADVLGRTRTVETLNADDFAKLRKHFSKGHSLVTLKNLITRSKVVFKFAEDYDLVENRIRGLAAFKKPTKSDLRREKERNGAEKMFTADQIHLLIEKATPQIKAMVLLAINAGLGNTDVANLSDSHIDADYLDYSRNKTGIKRRAKLWPETLTAINEVGLPFRTKYGHKWVTDGDNALSKTFRKLLDDCEIKTKGLTFYAIRHSYRTIADEVKDQPAIDLTMGHARDDMASIYREKISDDRLDAIAEYVRKWLQSVD